MDISAIASQGWTLGQCDSSTDDSLRRELTELARTLGQPTISSAGNPIVAKLQPTAAATARPGSLSSKFDFGAFPLHTDTANWAVPCRYMLLACLHAGCGNRKTVLFDSRRLELTSHDRKVLNSTPFRIMNGRFSFFSTVLKEGRPFVRYDPACMRALTPEGTKSLHLIERGAANGLAIPIEWIRGRVLIVDNWRTLHGRSLADGDDRARTLLRVYVKEAPV